MAEKQDKINGSEEEIKQENTVVGEEQASKGATDKAKKIKIKKIINITLTSLQIAMVAVALIFSIFLFVSPNDNSESVKNTPIKFITVLTSSMDGDYSEGDAVIDPWNVAYADIFDDSDEPAEGSLTRNNDVDGQTCSIGSFTRNDLLFGKVVDYRELKVGDVVAYKGHLSPADKEYHIISHRIIGISILQNETRTEYQFTVIGDSKDLSYNIDPHTGNRESVWVDVDNRTTCNAVYDLDGNLVTTDIQCKITGISKGFGAFIRWMQSGPNFLLIILIPLGLLLIYNVYLVVRMIMNEKIRKLQLANAAVLEEATAKAQIDEEEIKRRAIEEYLSKMQNGGQEPTEEQTSESEAKQDENKDE